MAKICFGENYIHLSQRVKINVHFLVQNLSTDMQKILFLKVMKNVKNVKSFSLQILIKIHINFKSILYPDTLKLLLSYMLGISGDLFPPLCFQAKEYP